MLEQINIEGELAAVIIRKDYHSNGIEFFTPGSFSQQLGYMNRPAGYTIQPHVHNIVERNITLTQEVLIIRKGKVRVDFYNDGKEYVESRVVGEGDIVLLASAGHGFEMLEDSEIVEVKQGPYSEKEDKTRFEAVDNSKIIITGE